MKYDLLQHFSFRVKDYDKVAECVVMNNQELYTKVFETLKLNPEQEIKVLDIGGTTWQAMHMILKNYPKSVVTAMFFSTDMLSKARDSLRKYESRCNFNLMNQKMTIAEDTYDAVISLVSIHNVSGSQRIELFKKIFNSLKREGQFINGDFYLGENNQLESQLLKLYTDFVKERLEGEERDFWIRLCGFGDVLF